MAFNNVSLVYSYFADPEKSQAISEGSCYVGNPDTDPEIGGNQKQVYHRQENGSDVPVSQPLQTGAGGVILINGSPAQIVVDGNYSIKVLDKSGAQKYYDSDRYDGEPLTVDTGVQAIDLLSDLISLTGSAGRQASVGGRTTVGDGYGGIFVFISGNQSANVTADPQQGIWVAPASDTSGTSGSWQRRYDGITYPAWFGATGGADDTTALDACIKYGGEIEIPSNHTYLTDGNHSMVSNSAIRGGGTIKRRSNTILPILNLDNISNVEIKGITIDGNKSAVLDTSPRAERKGEIRGNSLNDGNLTTHVTIDNVTVKDAHNWGIRFFGLQSAVITNSNIYDGDARGMGGGSNWADVRISDNRINNVYQSGISINGEGALTAPSGTSERVVVDSNTVKTVLYDSAVPFSGIGIEMIGRCTDSVISNNAVTNCDSMLISTGFTSRLTVEGNNLTSATYVAGQQQGWGIEITNVVDSTYADNNIDKVRYGYFAQACDDLTISGGTLIDTVRDTISGTAADTAAVFIKGLEDNEDDADVAAGQTPYAQASFNITVTGLTTKGWHEGVLIGNRCEKLQISNNFIDSPYHGADFGFGGLTTDPIDMSFNNNIVRGMFARGVRFNAVTTYFCKNNVFINERAPSTGVLVATSFNPNVENNSFFGLTNTGSGWELDLFTDGDTTPTVIKAGPFATANTAATSITTFDQGYPTQEILIAFSDANTTLVNGATLQLAGGANFVATTVDTIKLVYDGGKWIEVSRSVN